LEEWFGGLDHIYNFHHLIGLWGLAFIVSHPFVLALKWVPYRMDKFYAFIFPIHGRLSVNLGAFAFWLFLILIAITLSKCFPYDKWKISHKLMGVVFLLASLHFLTSDRLYGDSHLQKPLLCLPMVLGFFGIFYKQLFLDFLANYPKYIVRKIDKLNENVAEVFFEPKGEKISFIPGQYAFFSFKSSFLTEETHPFTLCSTADGASFSILVKARGDFTKSLFDYLRPGDIARVEGPYGRFDYIKGSYNNNFYNSRGKNGFISRVFFLGDSKLYPCGKTLSI
jgi:predicted ferric reductase